MALPRRTLEEWLTYFDVEPSVKHLFVEGPSDQVILEEFLENVNARIITRMIDDVDFSGIEIERSPFCSGNRARLYYFAHEIERRYGPIENVRLLIDRDCESLHVFIEGCLLLLVTDYASLYCTFVTYDFVSTIVKRAFKSVLPAETWERLLQACFFLFAFRVVRYRRFPSAKPLDVEKLINARGRVVELERNPS